MRQPQGNTASLQHTAASNAVACCHQSFAASFSWTCFSDFSLFLSQTPTRWLFPQAAILPCPQLCTATDDDTYTKVKHLHHSMISSADTVIATASTLPHEFSAVIDCRIRLQFQIQYGAIRKRDEYAGHKDRAQWLVYFEGVLAPCAHRACTAHAPCQVFEQLPQQMVYPERGCRWYLVGSEVLPSPLVGSEWLLLYPGGPWMVTVIS